MPKPSRKRTPPASVTEDVTHELARRYMNEFMRYGWPVIHGVGSKFISSFAVDAICEHLEAVFNGQIRKLLINVPPGHTKTLSTSVYFPAWAWLSKPHMRFFCASYSQDLATRDSVNCRRVIESEWYQQVNRNAFKLTTDQNTKTKFDNDKTGVRWSSSVGATTTGVHADIIIVDDPINVMDSMSALKRQTAITWFNESLPTRFANPETGAMIVIGQRVHQEDISGIILKQDGWEKLILPARYEAEHKCVTSIGWSDPRTVEGELLCPDRFNEAAIANLETNLGSYAAAGQLQQRPAPRGGGMVKTEWFQYGSPAANDKITLSIDCGNKTKAHNDPTVIGVWIQCSGRHFRVDEWRGRVDFPTLKATVISMIRNRKPHAVLVEDKAAGQQLIQELARVNDLDAPVIAINPVTDKATRLDGVTPMIEGKLVYLPEDASWLADYVTELTTFPAVAHDDRVDETSQYLSWSKSGRPVADILADMVGSGVRVSHNPPGSMDNYNPSDDMIDADDDDALDRRSKYRDVPDFNEGDFVDW